MGFPFDIQVPGSSRNVFIHFLHNKSIEDGNQTCSPPFLLRLVGRMTYLDLVGVLTLSKLSFLRTRDFRKPIFTRAIFYLVQYIG